MDIGITCGCEHVGHIGCVCGWDGGDGGVISGIGAGCGLHSGAGGGVHSGIGGGVHSGIDGGGFGNVSSSSSMTGGVGNGGSGAGFFSGFFSTPSPGLGFTGFSVLPGFFDPSWPFDFSGKNIFIPGTM